jgi:hypothetical protein
MVRHLCSPDEEFRRFLQLSENLNLPTLCLEYIEDKFVSNNDDKYYFGRMLFNFGVGKRGGKKLLPLNIIDFNLSNGKRICEVKTLWGASFVDFHHELLKLSLPENNITVEDFSQWFKRNGGIAEKYYEKYLSIFVCFGVLFENFFPVGKEQKFTDMALREFQKVKDRFGITPILAKVVDDGSETDLYWYSYQDFLQKVVDDRINPAFSSQPVRPPALPTAITPSTSPNPPSPP